MQSINMIVVLFLSMLFSLTNAHFVFPEGLDNKAKNFAAGSGKAPASAGAPPPSALENLKAQASGFNFNLTAKLPSATAKLTPLDVVPASCSAYVGSGDKAECKATMTATNVTFDDCGDSWTICRCSDAQMEIPTIIERFSRVPVGLRRYVGTVFVMGDKSPHAYSLTNGDIHMFNDCQMETWIHESVHSFDYASGAPISGTAEWLDALAKDTCAPDNYALSNRVEDFAQVSVLKIYQLAHDGELPPGFSRECMQRQLDYLDQLPLFAADTLFGNTCDLNLDYKFDFNLGAKKTANPTKLMKVKIFPLPGDDSPVINNAPPTETTDNTATITSSRFITRPLSTLNGPNPTSVPKKKVYDNAAGSSLVAPSFGVSYQVLLVLATLGWTLL